MVSAVSTIIYTGLAPQNATTGVRTLYECILAMQSWMTKNRLKLNPEKTKLLSIGTGKKMCSLARFSLNDILAVSTCELAMNLGVLVDTIFNT